MNTERLRFRDDGIIPNSRFEVLIHREIILVGRKIVPDSNGWIYSWSWKVYTYDHYHSNTHEALVIKKGNAVLRLGGPRNGKRIRVIEGDVVIIPAGVAHRAMRMSKDFWVHGYYTLGAPKWDENFGLKKERPMALDNLKRIKRRPQPFLQSEDTND